MKKTHFKQIILSVSMLLSLNSIGQNANFIDYGFIPTPSVSAGKDGASEFQTAIFNNGEIFIATSDGIWKNNISTQQWSSSGLQGKKISCIYKHPSIANKMFAGAQITTNNSTPLFISNDSGITWLPVTSTITETIYCIAVSPTNPDHIYANVASTDIISSQDGGINWSAPSGGFGYESNIIFTPSDGNTIYQGSENPLDCAWLGKYDIDSNNPDSIMNFQYVADGNCGSGPWENRRPNKLQTYSYTGNMIYVGQEGALSKVDPTQLNSITFIYKSEGEPNKPYTYVYGIWVDPLDINHVIFGGSKNGDNTGLMQIYETWDEGATFHRYTQTFGVTTPSICDIVHIDNNKVALIIYDQSVDRIKLIIMEPSQPLSIPNNQIKPENVSIYPNPADNTLNIDFSNVMNYDKIRVNIYSTDGKLIKSENMHANSLNLESFESGIYHLILNLDEQKIHKKFIVD